MERIKRILEVLAVMPLIIFAVLVLNSMSDKEFQELLEEDRTDG